MNTTKLYTHEQLKKAFEAGNAKGQAEVTGDSERFQGFSELSGSLEAYVVPSVRLAQIKLEAITVNVDRLHPLNIEAVTQAVSKVLDDRHFELGMAKVDYQDLVDNRRRYGRFMIPMQMVLYITYLHTPTILVEMGDFFGRDHATALYGAKKIARGVDIGDKRIAALLKYTYALLEEKNYDIFSHYRYHESLTSYNHNNFK